MIFLDKILATSTGQARKSFLVLTICLSSLACNSEQGGHAHDAHEGHGDHGDHGSHGPERPGHVVTMVQKQAELFVEFPALVAGKPSKFAAHFTTLDGYTPVTKGTLEVVLTSQDSPGENWDATAPTRDGIFTPTITPKYPGKRKLLLLLDTGTYKETFDLGEFQVVTKEADAKGGEDPGGEISFLKEQQWKVDFDIETATRSSIHPALAAHAEILLAPEGKANITAPFAGRISSGKEGLPKIGQKVEKGDILAYVTPSLGAGEISQLRTELRRAQLELGRAEREKARIEPLIQAGAISEKRLLEVENEIELAGVEVTQAKQRLNQHQTIASRGGGGSNRIAIHSPLTGTIAHRTLVDGGFVSSGEELFVVVDKSKLWLEAKIPEANLARITEPTGLWFKAPDQNDIIEIDATLDGKLISAGTIIDPITRQLPMIFSLEGVELPSTLRPGALLTVHLTDGAPHEGVVIPTSAVLDEKGVDTVFVMKGGESFERRAVRLGASDRGRVEVLQGIEEGEHVVSVGAYYVKLAGTSTGAVGHGHAH